MAIRPDTPVNAASPGAAAQQRGGTGACCTGCSGLGLLERGYLLLQIQHYARQAVEREVRNRERAADVALRLPDFEHVLALVS